MIEKSSTLYKMIILYMLEKVSFPLSNSQITNFFLDREYTTYFHVQQTIHDLMESNLITEKKKGQSICYETTEEGSKICAEVDAYLNAKAYEIRNENALKAEYYRTPEQEYVVQLQVKEKQTTLINLELTVPDKETAKNFCSHWSDKSQEIYAYLMENLS